MLHKMLMMIKDYLQEDLFKNKEKNKKKNQKDKKNQKNKKNKKNQKNQKNKKIKGPHSQMILNSMTFTYNYMI